MTQLDLFPQPRHCESGTVRLPPAIVGNPEVLFGPEREVDWPDRQPRGARSTVHGAMFNLSHPAGRAT